MKIAECPPLYYPSVGGTEIATMQLSKELKKLGHHVTILTHNVTSREIKLGTIKLNYSMGLDKMVKTDGIVTFRFPFTYVLSPKSMFSIPEALAVRASGYDVVHIQGFFDLPNLLLLSISAKTAGVPVIVTTHALYESTNWFHKNVAGLILRLALRIINRFVTTFVTLSKMEKEYLARLGIPRSKIVVIPNGVHFEKESGDERALASVLEDGFILCMSRFVRYKNIETLVRAFSSLPNLSVNLVVAGHVSDPTYFRELAATTTNERVHLLANVTEEQKRWLYRNCLLFVLPSSQDTSPLSLMEAMAAGKPVIATNVGAIPEIVSDSNNGFLFDPNDQYKLAELIEKLTTNTDLRERMGSRSLEFASKRKWTNVAEEVSLLFANIARSK